MAEPKPLVDLTDGELVLLSLSLLVSDLGGRVAKVSLASSQRIAAVGQELRKRAGVPPPVKPTVKA